MLAALLPAALEGRYRLAILTGLLFSLAGDVLLMLPSDAFLPGVAAFLAAHVAYLVAFTTFVALAAVPAAFAVVGLVIGVILAALWPRLPRGMRPALLIYGAVLGAMAAQAVTQAAVQPSAAAAAAAIGGILFIASDATLVTARFARPFRLAPLVVLGTYYAAQTLIALSVTLSAS